MDFPCNKMTRTPSRYIANQTTMLSQICYSPALLWRCDQVIIVHFRAGAGSIHRFIGASRAHGSQLQSQRDLSPTRFPFTAPSRQTRKQLTTHCRGCLSLCLEYVIFQSPKQPCRLRFAFTFLLSRMSPSSHVLFYLSLRIKEVISL